MEEFSDKRDIFCHELQTKITFIINRNYQKIDTEKICVAGMSCGGLQTLYNCTDPRIATFMVCNSGLFNQSNASSAVGEMKRENKSLPAIHTRGDDGGAEV